MRKLNLLTLLLALLLGALSVPALAHDHSGDDDAASKATSASQAPGDDPYYFATSPTGKALGDTPVVEVYEGRELRFADKADAAAFHKDADKYIAELNQRIIADQGEYYPLDVCPVTGEPLDVPVDYVSGNHLVRFCCEGCISEFETDPSKYLAKVDAAAIAKQSAAYPLDHCLLLPDEKFEPEHDILVGGRLFRLCCGGCEAKVRENPVEWIARLEEAWQGK